MIFQSTVLSQAEAKGSICYMLASYVNRHSTHFVLTLYLRNHYMIAQRDV